MDYSVLKTALWCDVMEEKNHINWTSLIGFKIRIWYFDGQKTISRDVIVSGIDNNTLFVNGGDGISLEKYIRHEVLGGHVQ